MPTEGKFCKGCGYFTAKNIENPNTVATWCFRHDIWMDPSYIYCDKYTTEPQRNPKKTIDNYFYNAVN